MPTCGPYYLPREFTSFCCCCVHSPDGNLKKCTGLWELYVVISSNMTQQPDGLFIAADDLDQTDLRAVQPACLWSYKHSWQIQSPPTSSLWPVQSYFSASSVYVLSVSTLQTHDCTPRHQQNCIVKYADNTIIIISHITDNDDVHRNILSGWCTENNLPLSVS